MGKKEAMKVANREGEIAAFYAKDGMVDHLETKKNSKSNHRHGLEY